MQYPVCLHIYIPDKLGLTNNRPAIFLPSEELVVERKAFATVAFSSASCQMIVR
jgi:hypothetical protein